jgi:hypothetical protein
MLVCTQDTNEVWQLKAPPWAGLDDDWVATMGGSASPEESRRIQTMEVKRIGAMEDQASIATVGSGETNFALTTTATEMSVGSIAKKPGRIYCSGRDLKNNGETQYLNGVNTPWHRWNEFGSTVPNMTYDHDWWDAEFARLVDRGVNATRVWLVCDSENEGVVLNADGTCQDPTAQFWADVDDLMSLAEAHEIFVMPVLFSFDNFDWNNSNSERWHLMLGSKAGVQSLITKYIIPLAERYKDNPWVWCLDLCNEMDWLSEKADLSTPNNVTATPVGGGSKIVDFGQKVSDFVVGQQLYLGNINMGVATERLSDTRCVFTNAFEGPSSEFIAGSGEGKWMFTGQSWRTIRRYLGTAASAIHRSRSTVLVTMGMGVIKYGSTMYDGDNYADSLLIAEATDSAGTLDVHQVHWYSWAEPWYSLKKSPTAHGLTAKPAIMGEFPAHWAGLNIPTMRAWAPETWYQIGNFVWQNDGGNFRKYECVQSGWSGLDNGPTGTGSNIVDGDALWNYVENTWHTNTEYAKYAMVIADSASTGGIGRIYIATQGGTSHPNSGGPNWTHETQDDGTVKWHYVREATTSEKEAYDFFIANGWCGHMPWTSNTVDANRGLYEVDLSNEAPSDWAATTDYYVKSMVLNDGNKLYRCITQGKSASSGGPTGTDADITDGTAHWKYVKTLSTPWTSAGLGIKDFSDENSDSIYPDTSGYWDNSGTVIRQSKQRAWFPTGLSEQVKLLFELGDGEAGVLKRIGLFDAEDGLFLLASGSDNTLSLVVRSNGEDTATSRASWNIDPLDGTGSSGITLDLSSKLILVIDFGWLNGINKMGFLVSGVAYWAHEFTFLASEYPANPNLHLRWEISAESEIDEKCTLKSYNGDVTTAGEVVSNHSSSGYRPGGAIEIGSSNTAEVLALRPKASMARVGAIKPKRLTILNTSGIESYIFNWKIVLNPIASSSGTWTEPAGSSLAEVSPGRNCASTPVLAQGFARGDCEIDLSTLQSLGVFADGTPDVLSVQITNLTNSTHWFYVSLEWDESM